jgi:hypothetical protein
LEQIEAEYQAGKQALSGLAEGSSRHDFIERRLTRMGELHSSLQALVGDEAIALLAHTLDALPESTEQASS